MAGVRSDGQRGVNLQRTAKIGEPQVRAMNVGIAVQKWIAADVLRADVCTVRALLVGRYQSGPD